MAALPHRVNRTRARARLHQSGCVGRGPFRCGRSDPRRLAADLDQRDHHARRPPGSASALARTAEQARTIASALAEVGTPSGRSRTPNGRSRRRTPAWRSRRSRRASVTSACRRGRWASWRPGRRRPPRVLPSASSSRPGLRRAVRAAAVLRAERDALPGQRTDQEALRSAAQLLTGSLTAVAREEERLSTLVDKAEELGRRPGSSPSSTPTCCRQSGVRHRDRHVDGGPRGVARVDRPSAQRAGGCPRQHACERRGLPRVRVPRASPARSSVRQHVAGHGRADRHREGGCRCSSEGGRHGGRRRGSGAVGSRRVRPGRHRPRRSTRRHLQVQLPTTCHVHGRRTRRRSRQPTPLPGSRSNWRACSDARPSSRARSPAWTRPLRSSRARSGSVTSRSSARSSASVPSSATRRRQALSCRRHAPASRCSPP